MVIHATTKANPRNKRNIVFRFIDWEIVADSLREELMEIVGGEA